MSLINEALKKAQRERSNPPAGMLNADGGPTQRVTSPPRPQSLILIGAGAVVLVAFSVVLTVYFLNRAPAPVVAAPIASTALPVATSDSSTPSPVAPAPVISLAIPVVEKSPPVVAAPEPVIAAAPIAAPPPAPAAREPELHIQLFVDAIRVMGVRSSGGESKVLMNDRVYRVNDIVDRKLVLKLVKVEPELLTFTDPNGMVYTKSF
jgi:hypothetical protein